MNKYYAMAVQGKEADVYIFGDITSWEWLENDVSSYTLSKDLAALDNDVEQINVHINSYGGEVAEGIAIYNTLRSHKAKVRTICDGFACSIASVIFMAGEERIMRPSSLLMVHNVWTYTAGNADQLRKAADDLDVIGTTGIAAYMSGVNITEEELKALLDAESWIVPEDAVAKGFATCIEDAASASGKPAANARLVVMQMITAQQEPTPQAQPGDGGEMPALTIYANDTSISIYDREVASQYVTRLLDDKGAGCQEGREGREGQGNKTLKLFNALIGGKE